MADIKCPLMEAAEISKHETGLITTEGRWTYYELDQIVSAAALRLQEAGILPGERVGLLLDNEWRAPVLMLALIRVGAVAGLLNVQWPAEVLLPALRKAGIRRVLADISGDWKSPSDDVQGLDAGAMAREEMPFSVPAFHPRIPSGQPATILFAGAECVPVLHDFGSHYYGAHGFNTTAQLRSRDRILLVGALYQPQAVAAVYRALLAGSALVISSRSEPVGRTLVAKQITHAALDAEQLAALWAEGVALKKAEALRVLAVSGPVPEPLLQAVLAARWPVYRSYGRPETGVAVTMVRLDAAPDRRSSFGAVQRHAELRLSAEGEILVRGPMLLSGYVEGDALRRATDDEGWFATGDLGHFDDAGCLLVTGRKA